ncbi:hypothetical protein Tco_0931186 [Tanacetum coccineum]
MASISRFDLDKMADKNVPALAPTRSDDQILPFAAWVPIGKSNYTFLIDKANLGSPTKKGRKDKPHVIPYCRFTKLIICHLGRIHNIHQRSASPFHLTEEDLRLGNLKFVSKGEDDEVFGMPIPNELISNNIRNVPYYNAYLEMVAKHDRKITIEQGGKKKPVTAKQPKPKPTKEKPSKLAPTSKPKVSKEKPLKPSTDKPPKPKPVKEKSTKLVDEPNEELAQPEPEAEHQGDGEEYDFERAIQMSLESFHAVGHAHVGATEEASTGPYAQPQDDTSANIVRDSPSPVDAETGADTYKTNSGDQAGSDPGESLESRPQPEQDLLSSTGTLSSMKNLEDAYAIGDQFINNKSTDDESEKLNVEAEVVFMVTVPIYQASSSVPSLKEASTGPYAQPQDDTSANIVRDSPSPVDAETGADTYKTNSGGDTKIMQFGDEHGDEIANVVNIEERIAEIDEDPKHIALYKALEASMEQAQRDEFFAKRDKSCKRRRDDQDPPPPPPDYDRSKKKRHDSGASGSS